MRIHLLFFLFPQLDCIFQSFPGLGVAMGLHLPSGLTEIIYGFWAWPIKASETPSLSKWGGLSGNHEEESWNWRKLEQSFPAFAPHMTHLAMGQKRKSYYVKLVRIGGYLSQEWPYLSRYSVCGSFLPHCMKPVANSTEFWSKPIFSQ